MKSSSASSPNRLGITFMLTGSYASNIYGRIRSTFDADIVLALHAPDLKNLLGSLGADFYVDAASMKEVREAGGHFNAVHRPSGLKLDYLKSRAGGLGVLERLDSILTVMGSAKTPVVNSQRRMVKTMARN